MNNDLDAIRKMGLNALGIDIVPKAEGSTAREARQKLMEKLASELDNALSQKTKENRT